MLHKNCKNSEFLKVFDHIFTDGCTAHVTALNIDAHHCELYCTGDAGLCFEGKSLGTPQSQKLSRVNSLQETQCWTVWEAKL